MCFLEVPEENNRRGAQRWRGLGAARAGESGPRNERTGCRSCGSGGGVPLVPAKPKNHNTLSLSVAVNLDEKQNRRERKKTNPSHTAAPESETGTTLDPGPEPDSEVQQEITGLRSAWRVFILQPLLPPQPATPTAALPFYQSERLRLYLHI